MFVQKATALVFRRPKTAPQLLAFEWKGNPQNRLELPGGTVYLGEPVKAGVVRELWEESGLKDLKLIQKLGTYSYYKPKLKKTVERHFFMFKGPKTLPDTWEHKVKGKGGDRGMKACYRWLNAEEALLLDWEYHAYLTPQALPNFFTPEKLLGLTNGSISLMPHTFLWQEAFEAERRLLQGKITKHVLDIQHIGSTAIPTIPAKPIIDICIAVKSLKKAKALILPLEAMGYRHRGENGIPGRHYFVKEQGEKRTHHLHVFEETNPKWAAHLHFRDTLRKNPELAQEYGRLKLRLWRNLKNDRAAYTAGKDVFFQKYFKKEVIG